MDKIVIVINGKGGVGKDTLCDFVSRKYRVKNISSVTPIKKIALDNGWKGEKDAKSRKFLADLKKTFVEYNDLPNRYLIEEYKKFLKSEDQILFVQIREAAEIDKFKSKVTIPCITLLIQRGKKAHKSWGNESDDKVEEYKYDYTYRNDSELEEAEKDFVQCLEHIINITLEKRNFKKRTGRPFEVITQGGRVVDFARPKRVVQKGI